jgi:hypothetical protein
VNIEPNETALLSTFARAASKAQEIEALFRDSLIAAEIAMDMALEDTRVRSFEDIARKIDRLPLGALKEKFFKVFAEELSNSGVKDVFDAVNDERIFLMHNFFQTFPVEKLDGNKEAAIRLGRIDKSSEPVCRCFAVHTSARLLSAKFLRQGSARFSNPCSTIEKTRKSQSSGCYKSILTKSVRAVINATSI